MEITSSVRSVSRQLAFVALVATGVLACAQEQPGQEKKSNSSTTVVLASAATVPTTTTTTPAPAPPPPASGFSWTGPYVGVTFGYASASADTFVNPLPTAAIFFNLLPQTLTQDPSGLLGGGEIGYNWQRGRFVLGPEADISAAGIDGTKQVAPIIQNNGTPLPGGPGNNIKVNQRTDALSTVRGRFGVTLGSRVLVYGTGGLAVGHVGYTANTDFRPGGTEQYIAAFSRTQTGWTGGGGLEFAVGKGFTMRAEYLHYNLGSKSFTANPSIPFPPGAPNFQVAYTWSDVTANVARFGFGFKF